MPKDIRMNARRSRYLLAAFASAVTLAVYLPALGNDFLNWDDGTYVVHNPHIRELGPAFFRWAFSSFYAGNWHPLTWMSHALDYAVWGLNPMGHHLTSIALHAANTFLVVLLCAELMEAQRARRPAGEDASFPDGRAAMVAAGITGILFGLHPLHVESVAWVSERKDLLCGLFFLLSTLSYLAYRSDMPPKPHKSYRAYFLSLALFILALMSKPMAVSLPAVLLILDWYPLRRIVSPGTFRDSLLGKLPFIVPGLGAAALTMAAQKGAMATAPAPAAVRAIVAAKSLLWYLGKTVVPVDLLPIYPYPGQISLPADLLFPAALAFLLFGACIALRRRRRVFPAAMGYYCVTLLPVLGVVRFGNQSMADRYFYLPGLAPLLLIGLGAAWVAGKAGATRLRPAVSAAALLGVALVIVLVYHTERQISVWKDGVTFWGYVIDREADRVPIAYTNRGMVFGERGRFDRAIEDFTVAISLNPADYKAYTNRGIMYLRTGRFADAGKDFTAAITRAPSYVDAYVGLGMACERLERPADAVESYSRALALNPAFVAGYLSRGDVYMNTGNEERAARDYRTACAMGSEEGCSALRRLGIRR